MDDSGCKMANQAYSDRAGMTSILLIMDDSGCKMANDAKWLIRHIPFGIESRI
jgi:hypothetical protein